MAKEVCIFCLFFTQWHWRYRSRQIVWQHGPVCYSVDQILLPSPPVTMSEDCLYIDVYTPRSTETDSWATSEANGLPVMIWIQGGAVVEQFNPNYNGTRIVEASGGNVVVVTFNYRVGPNRFLASDELLQGNLNLGLHDQRAAISWVQSHVSQFGGDPNRVTLFGTSIGGGMLLQTLRMVVTTPRLIELIMLGGMPVSQLRSICHRFIPFRTIDCNIVSFSMPRTALAVPVSDLLNPKKYRQRTSGDRLSLTNKSAIVSLWPCNRWRPLHGPATFNAQGRQFS